MLDERGVMKQSPSPPVLAGDVSLQDPCLASQQVVWRQVPLGIKPALKYSSQFCLGGGLR